MNGRVDGEDHAGVAMSDLSAVEESGIRIVDGDDESSPTVLSFVSCYRGGFLCR
jgi:hypothetical protein